MYGLNDRIPGLFVMMLVVFFVFTHDLSNCDGMILQLPRSLGLMFFQGGCNPGNLPEAFTEFFKLCPKILPTQTALFTTASLS